jgi:hypothetical protein
MDNDDNMDIDDNSTLENAKYLTYMNNMQSINKDNELNLYLWIVHGGNVGTHNNYYMIETKFKALVFYSRPFENITTEFLNDLSSSSSSSQICKLIIGSCPIIPVINSSSKKKEVILPPLVFMLDSNDVDIIKNYTGLYHFVISQKKSIEKEHEPICSIISNEIIYNHSKFIEKYGDKSNVTYSQLFNEVYNDCKKKRLNPEDVMLGIYSCQSSNDEYKDEYNNNIINMIPKVVNVKLSDAIILNSINDVPENNNISIFTIPILKLDKFEALAKIKIQGCALNVLSYYGIINQTFAREQTVCLTMKGTSIFTIINYLNDYLIKLGITNNEFIIMRSSLKFGLTTISNFINNYKIINNKINYTIIFKLYREYFKVNSNNEFSQIGHTVSIANFNDKIYYIDPQAGVYQEITDFNAMLSYLLNLGFLYIDVIYIVNTLNDKPHLIKNEVINIINNNVENVSIVYRNESTTHGGKKKHKMKNVSNEKVTKHKKTEKKRKKQRK